MNASSADLDRINQKVERTTVFHAREEDFNQKLDKRLVCLARLVDTVIPLILVVEDLLHVRQEHTMIMKARLNQVLVKTVLLGHSASLLELTITPLVRNVPAEAIQVKKVKANVLCVHQEHIRQMKAKLLASHVHEGHMQTSKVLPNALSVHSV